MIESQFVGVNNKKEPPQNLTADLATFDSRKSSSMGVVTPRPSTLVHKYSHVAASLLTKGYKSAYNMDCLRVPRPSFTLCPSNNCSYEYPRQARTAPRILPAHHKPSYRHYFHGFSFRWLHSIRILAPPPHSKRQTYILRSERKFFQRFIFCYRCQT